MKVEYYAKIIYKNDAGTWNLTAQRETDNSQVSVVAGLGYAPVPKPVYDHIILPNPITNMVTCQMFLFRDGGVPTRGGWIVKFQIVHFLGAGNETGVTPIYDIRAKDYYDGCGLQMELSPFCTPQEIKQLLIRNTQLYKDYQNSAGKVFKYPEANKSSNKGRGK